MCGPLVQGHTRAGYGEAEAGLSPGQVLFPSLCHHHTNRLQEAPPGSVSRPVKSG